MSGTNPPKAHSHCSICGGWGAILWQQQTKTGHLVDVAYRCSCPAGMANYPNLGPAAPVPPQTPYEPERY